ncbi:transglutaminase-like domain-containing protein [Paenibacillus hexagrammi]|uniref:Transglutaminase-like domain-containing protein n=1 Tax=Paenibacillus hexagrammi TaxID=2908839 RepID=A0ABY3SP84_9BACL|nr:transglutaminase-like domain-containing protein [Paenibacillus sp. YPD9-1]UJF35016.1 transglutaminase-like domain-containing protein [Paenibacillus sp. YPD9-1]
MRERWLVRFLVKDWPLRLHTILLGVFLYQFVIWIHKEEVIWLNETVMLVSGTLLIAGLLRVCTGLNKWLSGAVQIVLILLIHGLYLHYHYIALRGRTAEALLSWITANLNPIEPYIWFSLSAWLIFLFALWFMRTKLRIFILIVISVLFFAIRDSFSVYVLWPQAAMVLFCGLSLMVLRHFMELKNRAPAIWETISEYPSTVGVPLVSIIALTVFIGAVTPSINPILRDPYTAWKMSRGESVPLLGKGVSVESPTSDTSSGYSRDDTALGGGFKYDYSPVMTVETSKRTYFRGETRALYTGTGWVKSEAEKKVPLNFVSVTELHQDPRFDVSLLQTKEVTQHVVMEKEEQFPVLFGGYPIQKITEVNKGENPFQLLLWSPRQAELRFVGEKNYPKEYQIVTQEAVIDEEGLRKVNEDYKSKPEWSEYLQLPDELPERVKQLAVDITKSGANSYDKAKLIEKYLSETFPYTNTPDESKAQSKDFTDRFLFEIKQGYCDYYSTAMAVMARSIGLPSRWVKGYSSGSSPIPDDILQYGAGSRYFEEVDVDGAGTYTVRNSDAHSWVEIYFAGYGWISFEPTSGFRLPNVYPDNEPDPVDVAAFAADAEEVDADAANTHIHWLWITAIVFGAAILGAAVFVVIRRGFTLPRYVRRTKREAVDFNQKIILEFEKLQRYSRRKGFARLEHQTLRETVSAWSEISKWIKNDLSTLQLQFERAKYSTERMEESDYLLVQQSIARIKEHMK